jgi:hypothetical protein
MKRRKEEKKEAKEEEMGALVLKSPKMGAAVMISRNQDEKDFQTLITISRGPSIGQLGSYKRRGGKGDSLSVTFINHPLQMS